MGVNGKAIDQILIYSLYFPCPVKGCQLLFHFVTWLHLATPCWRCSLHGYSFFYENNLDSGC